MIMVPTGSRQYLIDFRAQPDQLPALVDQESGSLHGEYCGKILRLIEACKGLLDETKIIINSSYNSTI